jgi:epoxyqueuosine reductase
MAAAKPAFTPDPEQMALWPAVSGNSINGVGEPNPLRPTPIYWHDPDKTPHGALQRWFYAQTPNDPQIAQARAARQKIIDAPLSPLAARAVEQPAQAWSEQVKDVARQHGADLVGIAAVRPEWVFEGYAVPQRWVIMIGVAHAYDQMKTAPEPAAAAEVIRQYGRGNQAAKGLASWIREQGHDAVPHGGPMAGPMLLIPPAIECGFGELGKHGSIIHREFGSSFRLASVLTDLPLLADRADQFGADQFCLHCKVCSEACPPDAILPAKTLVRGVVKWYVDFDKCLPYFNQSIGCGICVAVCPYSRPGVAANLVAKMARRIHSDATPDLS